MTQRKTLITTLIIFFSFIDVFSQNLFNKNYGGNKDEQFGKILEAKDGGFILLGYSLSYKDSTEEDLLIIKTNESGEVEWEITYGELDVEEKVVDAFHNIDNTFIIALNVRESLPWKDYPTLLKYDDDGNLLISKTYKNLQNSDDIRTEKLISLKNGFSVLSMVNTESNNDWGLLMKLNSQLDSVFTKPLKGLAYNEYLMKVSAVNSSGDIYATFSSSDTTGGRDTNGVLNRASFWGVAKLDNNLNFLWEKRIRKKEIAGNYFPRSSNLILDSYGDLVFINDGLGARPVFNKWSSKGDSIVSNEFGSKDFFNTQLIQSSDGKYMVTAMKGAFQAGSTVQLTKVNGAGIESWSKPIEISCFIHPKTILHNSGDLIIGGTREIDEDDCDLFMIRADKDGNFVEVGVEDNSLVSTMLSHFYPNPTHNTITLELSNLAKLPVTVEIYSSIGQKINEVILRSRNQTINLEGYESGLYIITIKDQFMNNQQLRVVKR